MSEIVKVKVLRMHSGDQGIKTEGDTYETTRQHATQLGKLVEIVGKAEAVPANKALSGAPENKGGGGTGGQVPTAAEILALAGGNFMSFKSSAKKLLGDAVPAKKPEIVAALVDKLSDTELKTFLGSKGVATTDETRDELVALAVAADK